MDEADRILNMDFEVEVDKILRVIPRERRTLLFSATMTKKVQKLQRASLRNPVKVEVSTKYQTVEKLQQYYIFIPVKFKVRNINDVTIKSQNKISITTYIFVKYYTKIFLVIYKMIVVGCISCTYLE